MGTGTAVLTDRINRHVMNPKQGHQDLVSTSSAHKKQRGDNADIAHRLQIRVRLGNDPEEAGLDQESTKH